MNNSLHKTIMRRVYYAFAINLATHPVTAYTLAVFALGWWLKELVFVARIWQSFVTTPVGELGSFTLSLLRGADYLTLVVSLVAVLCLVALLREMRYLRLPLPQLV